MLTTQSWWIECTKERSINLIPELKYIQRRQELNPS